MKRGRVIGTAAVGLAIAAAYCAWRGLFAMAAWERVTRTLCDAFFIPAVVLLGLGALMYVSNEGFFDVATFGMRSMLWLFHPAGEKARNRQDFAEYRAQKHENPARPGVLLAVGGAFLMISLVFNVLNLMA